MKKSLLFKLFALVAAMMCALGASAAEAYANYTPSNLKLTFYYDNLRSTRTGTIYFLNTANQSPGWGNISSDLLSVVFDSSFADARPTSTCFWFYGMNHLKAISGLAYLNTSEVTDMSSMFAYCNTMASLDLSHFNTANVTDMRGMFSGFSSGQSSSLDLSSFNTSNVTNMSGMFQGCSDLVTIYVGSHWTTTPVTSSSGMFTGCTSLVGGQGTTYDANHVDAAYAHIDGGTAAPGYFTADPNAVLEAYACYTADNTTLTFYYDILRSTRTGTTYDLNTGSNDPGWYTDGTCSSVTQVVFDASFAHARPRSAYRWFYNMRNLQAITGMKEYLNTEEMTSMYGMFYYCKSLTSLDLSNFNTEKVTSMQSMFMYCSGLTTLDLSSFNTEKVTNMQYMFGFSSGFTSLNLSSFNPKKVSNMYGLFYQCSNLATIYVGSDWNTESVSTYGSKFLFKNCTSLVGGMGTTYDADHEDVTYAHIDGGPTNPGYFTNINTLEAYACYTADNMTLTFYYDSQRSSRPGTTYDLNDENRSPDWATTINSSVTQVVFDPSFAYARPISTIFWFYSMSNLSTIMGIEYLNTSKVTKMNLMFSGCSSLTSLDLSSFNTANVISMESMFAGCTSLTTLNLSSFNTSKVTDMFHMFYNCSSLTSLDLSHFNTSKVSDMEEVFYNCSNLTTIYAGEGWSTAAVTSSSYMFHGCRSLVGGAGTTYDASHVDKAYAHIDGGPSNPGYFTAEGAQPWTESEAYACYTVDNKTLTFYFDNQRSSREGDYVRTYDLPTGNDFPGWGTDYTNIWVTSVVFDPSFVNVLPTSTGSWFSGMSDLRSITGMKEYLNTSEVTDMRYMFYFCNNLTGLDLSEFNTQNVAHMDSMFYSCSALTSLDLSNFNTSNVTTMNAMFLGCSGLTTLDLSSFNTANVTKMTYLFRYCSGLKTIFAGDGWSTASAPYGLVGMFQGCTSLVGGQGTAYDPNHTDGSYAHIDGGPDNPGYFTAAGTEAYACFTPSNTTLTFYYDNLRSSREGMTYDLNEGSNDPGWCTDGTKYNVFQVVFDPSFANASPTSTCAWFEEMQNLESITGIEYLNTSEVTNMSYMFYSSYYITSLDLSRFNTSKVTSMSLMFGCCYSLTSLDLSNFNTENVTDMSGMFAGCPVLTSLDLSSFNTEKVTSMQSMFMSCNGLTTLDLSSFKTSLVSAVGDMFNGCSKLKTIYVSERWDTENASMSDDMFTGCRRLVGGMGTTYDANHVDKAYAHIDGGTSNPGYFTAKPTALRGDLNGDNLIDINDVTLLIDVVLGKNVTYNAAAADCNTAVGDGTIDINDVTTLINRVLTGNW